MWKMARKRKDSDEQEKQLSLFENEDVSNAEQSDESEDLLDRVVDNIKL